MYFRVITGVREVCPVSLASFPGGSALGCSGVGFSLWSAPCQRFAVGIGLMVQL